MEDWGSQTATVQEVLAQKIKQSHLFIGLVGGLYGSLCPAGEQKVSYTRYEYDVACRLGTPVLMYVVPDDVPLLPWNLLESDELRGLQGEFRDKVKTDTYFAFIKTPEEFATRVLLDIRNWERNWEKHRPKPSHKAPAFQVPAPPQNLLGREDAIQQALKSLHDNSNVLLHGMRGVGKSAIAYHIAHVLKVKKVYVDLKATSAYEQNTTSLIVKEKIIRALQPEAMLSTADEIERVYNNVRSQGRTFIVLDSVRPEHIKNLKSPDQSQFAFIFTSYRHLQFPKLNHIHVGTLSPEIACHVLQLHSGDVQFMESQLRAITELCGYLPLAIRAAAGYLSSHPTDPVENYIRMLKDSPLEILRVGDIDVPRELAVPVRALERSDPELARKWRRLSVFPGDFDDQAAAAVWPVFEHDAIDVLSALKDRNLVMYDSGSDRYRLHDLMRLIAQTDFARGDEEGDREQTYAQHAKYFVSVLGKANACFVKGGTDIIAGLQLFDREMANIQMGHSWAEQNAETNKVAASLCIEYVTVGADVLSLRLLPESHLRWLETALKVAQKESDSLSEAFLLNERGVVYRESADPNRAIKDHQDVLTKINAKENPCLWSRALGNLGRAHWELGGFREAGDCYTKSLKAIEHIENPGRLEDVQREGMLDCLGIAYRELGYPKEAIKHHQQALDLANQLKDLRAKVRALDNLGLDLHAQGRSEEALRYHQEALQIAGEISDSMEKAAILGHLSMIYRTIGKTEEAERCGNEALSVAMTLGDGRMEGRILGDIALIYHDRGEFDRARRLHDQHLSIARATGDLWGEIAALDHLGSLHRDMRDLEKAAEYLELGLRKAESCEKKISL